LLRSRKVGRIFFGRLLFMNPGSSSTAPTKQTSFGLFPSIRKAKVEVLQFNIGRLCNQACHHCHVDSSPKRSGPEDNASPLLIDQVLELLRRDPAVQTLDITGGAPEMNPSFRRLVEGARALGHQVLVRHNLTVQELEGQSDLPAFFATQQVVLFCSLPCYLEDNVDSQRGNGVFEASIRGLKALNAVGFGIDGTGLDLHLVYNPQGAVLPPPQAALQEDYKRELASRFGIHFRELFAITNQPIHRFRKALERSGALETYAALLRDNFNPLTLNSLMCRSAVSVRWDGKLFDCDFNLVTDLPLRGTDGKELQLSHLLDPGGVQRLEQLAIAVDQHCFACTAGCGSSCGGTLTE
jgi:radical SAM/Cys-rich protein